MQIDKQNGNVKYNDEYHKYWDDEVTYTSVTTLIHKYQQPFNADFWSSYKALEKLMDKEDWKIEKKNLLSTKRFNKELLDLYSITEEDFNSTKQSIIDEWEAKKNEACERGTGIHLEKELEFYKEATDIKLDKFNIGGKFECKKGKTELDLDYGVYPEYLIYLKEGNLAIAGQIDVLIKAGNEIHIRDYKTNKELKFKSGYDSTTKKSAKMLYPLNTLDDCNMSHYALQLSTYAYMIQKLNPEFVVKSLVIVHYPHEGGEVHYPVDYKKKEVELMLKHYSKELDRKRIKSLNTPVVY